MSFLDNLAAMLQGGGAGVGAGGNFQSMQTPTDFSGGIPGMGGGVFGAPGGGAAGMPMGGTDTSGVPGGLAQPGLLGMLGRGLQNPALTQQIAKIGAPPTSLPMTAGGGMGGPMGGINPMMMGRMMGGSPIQPAMVGGQPPTMGAQPNLNFNSILQALRQNMMPGGGGMGGGGM